MLSARICRTWILIPLLLVAILLPAQTDTAALSAPLEDIPLVIVRATRIQTSPLNAPLSVSTYQANALQQSRQQLSLQEYLQQVPGLFSLNAHNAAQDLRISIRGFGSRAAFGIRGITLLVDGIPETTPDGQGQVDNLNLGIVDRIEVIRGPTSTLYGNAAGGVISIQTLAEPDSSYWQAGATFGAYQYQQYQLLRAIKGRQTDYILQGSYTQSDGYRERSAFQALNFNARAFHRFSDRSLLKVQFNYANSPKAEDPGGINWTSVQEDRRQARDRNLLFETGEVIDQWKAGLHFSHRFSRQLQLESYGFYADRSFEGRLPFENGGWINLDRNYWGQGSSLRFQKAIAGGNNQLQIGYQLAFQYDDRQRYFNLVSRPGELTLDQSERFYTAGLYLVDHWSKGRWKLHLGLRYDWNRLQAIDRFLSDGDDSGQRQLNAWSPSLGLSYRFSSFYYGYASFSSSFETPTLSELSANPSGQQGFNAELEAQQARNYEIGFKSQVSDFLNLQFALFFISTDDDLVPFELEAFPDRSFFRNAGTTHRKGIELSATYTFVEHWQLSGMYTYSDFTYEEFNTPDADFAGQQLPGIPRHMAAATLSFLQAEGWQAELQSRFVGSLYADDGNEEEVSDFVLLNIRAAYSLQFSQIRLLPFFGINNLLDADYFDNIRINAFGNRYYESGPAIHLYGGCRVQF